MNWLQSILYGFVSGLCEFIPVSSKGHRLILSALFGLPERDPLAGMLIHIAVLLSIFTCCGNLIEQYRRNSRIPTGSRRHSALRALPENRFVKSASIALCAGLVIATYAGKKAYSLVELSLLFVLNGAILFLPSRMLQGNKDARSMSALDSTLTGILGAASAFPGISRIGCLTSVALARGSDKEHALNWALLISIPALVLLAVFDFFGIFSAAPALSFLILLKYILLMFCAYLGGCASIVLMKFMSVRIGFNGFAFYSWGAALFTFILYLI